MKKRHLRVTHLSEMFLVLLNFVLKDLCEKKDYEKLRAVRKRFLKCKTHKAYFLSMKLRWLFSFIELHIPVEDIETKC